MNYGKEKSSPSFIDCGLNNKSKKKSKRKRLKNKCKNYISRLKKKNHKKFYSGNMTDNSFSKSKKSPHTYSNLPVDVAQLTSSWYWSNYKKALEWRDTNKIAYWKACALALQEENRYLKKLINSIQPGLCPQLPMTMHNLTRKSDVNKKYSKSRSSKSSTCENISCTNSVENVEEEVADDEIEFEMSEEMIKFFEQSFKHKMDLKKQKEENEYQVDVDREIKQIQAIKLRRSEEMKLLYGDGASMITGMETAVQLSFDRYCDTKSPKYWPNIPLRL